MLTTAALVFTSYLGFAQIATVAGDIRDPGRNLPRAMLGSVLAVGLLYVVMIVVSTSTFPSDTLASFGETAAVEVAQRLLGPLGALVVTTTTSGMLRPTNLTIREPRRRSTAPANGGWPVECP